MKTIFADFDRKTHSVELVKESDNIQTFERWFASVFLRGDGMFALYPEDYDIYSLTMFNPETLDIDAECRPDLICNVSQLFDIFNIPRPSFAPSGE